jgi:hypothetical protein
MRVLVLNGDTGTDEESLIAGAVARCLQASA